MKRLFRVQPFGAVTHTKETYEILSQTGHWRKSQFVRMAILEYAEKLGYEHNEDAKPDYVSCENWEVFKKHRNSSNIVDYSFILAFYWLKSLPHFQYIENSELLRMIISDSRHLLPEVAA